MSTRYVWSKNTLKYTAKKLDSPNTGAIVHGENDSQGGPILSSGYYITSDGKFTPSGSIQHLYFSNGNAEEYTIPTSPYRYGFNHDLMSNILEAGNSATNWKVSLGGDGKVYAQSSNGITYTIITEEASGDFVAYVSANSRSAYPDDGTFSTFYYKFLGSDSIDPTSVNYSEGENYVTIRINIPGNTLGGTIYYQYSYSTDGGNTWINAGDKTTETSKTVNIPDGITQFKGRVLASDDIGFVSSDYVLGANITIQNFRAYVGVSGKARKVDKLYVGVNGKARQVVKGYVGVSGEARRFI